MLQTLLVDFKITIGHQVTLASVNAQWRSQHVRTYARAYNLTQPKNIFFKKLSVIFTFYRNLYRRPILIHLQTTGKHYYMFACRSNTMSPNHDKSDIARLPEGDHLTQLTLSNENEMNRALGHLCAHIG